MPPCCTTAGFPRATKDPYFDAAALQGRRVVPEWGWLGKVEKADRQYVRRITKRWPESKGLGVVTDLLDELKDPAEAMLRTSRSRWGIETVFHQITDVFSLRHLIGTMPKAVLFQLSFRLPLYNALQVVPAHLASYQECEAKRISNEKLLDDVKRPRVAVSEWVDVEPLLSLLGEVPTAAELSGSLRARLRGAGSDRWWKAPRSGRGGHQKVRTRVPGNHTSTYRVLQQAREQKKQPPATAPRP
jgi:hypothetical protein